LEIEGEPPESTYRFNHALRDQFSSTAEAAPEVVANTHSGEDYDAIELARQGQRASPRCEMPHFALLCYQLGE
jgi:hypothetical protein